MPRALLFVLPLSLTACVPPSASARLRAVRADSVAKAAIAREGQIDPRTISPNTIGVVPLRVVSTDTAYDALGHALAALIATDLSQSRSLRVVERLEVDALLRELALVGTGRVDSATAPRVGKLVGASRLVVGSVEVARDGGVRLDSRVARTATGEVTLAVGGATTLKRLLDAQKAVVFRLFDQLNVALTPAERRRIEQRPTRSLEALLAFGRGVRAQQQGDFESATVNFRQAVRIDPGILQLANQGSSGAPTGADRLGGLAADLVNRPTNGPVGTAADAAVTTRQQLLTVTITVRTP